MRKFVFLFSLAALFLFNNCGSLRSPLMALEGKWTCSGSIDEQHAWYLEYIFKDNKYTMVGYPPISETGTIELKQTKGDSLLVEFKVIKSDPVYKNHTDWVYIKGNQFTLHSNTFTKTNEEKK